MRRRGLANALGGRLGLEVRIDLTLSGSVSGVEGLYSANNTAYDVLALQPSKTAEQFEDVWCPVTTASCCACRFKSCLLFWADKNYTIHILQMMGLSHHFSIDRPIVNIGDVAFCSGFILQSMSLVDWMETIASVTSSCGPRTPPCLRCTAPA